MIKEDLLCCRVSGCCRFSDFQDSIHSNYEQASGFQSGAGRTLGSVGYVGFDLFEQFSVSANSSCSGLEGPAGLLNAKHHRRCPESKMKQVVSSSSPLISPNAAQSMGASIEGGEVSALWALWPVVLRLSLINTLLARGGFELAVARNLW